MRIAAGLLASAIVLFVSGATHLIGTWGLAAGVCFAVAAAIDAVVVMEERDRMADSTATEAAYVARLELN